MKKKLSSVSKYLKHYPTEFKLLKKLCKFQLVNPFLQNTHFNTLKKKATENIVEKSKIAQNEQFHLFPQCFPRNLYIKIFE